MEKDTVHLSQVEEDIDTSLRDRNSIIKIRNGDYAELNNLMERYQSFVYHKSTPYFLAGAEKEDIVQEGMIGLYKAIKNYDLEKDISFKYFADLCIKRQIITAIKTYSRQKHIPLNSYISLNKEAYENEEESGSDLIEILDSKTVEDPLDTLTKKEYYKSVENTIDKSLSDFEKKVLNCYIQGESYVEIAQKLDTPVKSIDNAIQRIRKKAIKGIANEL